MTVTQLSNGALWRLVDAARRRHPGVSTWTDDERAAWEILKAKGAA